MRKAEIYFKDEFAGELSNWMMVVSFFNIIPGGWKIPLKGQLV